MKRSNWWYILPILFGFIGGVITFLALRNSDKDKAVNALFLGIGITVLHVLLNVSAFFGVAYTPWENDVITIPDCNLEPC